MKRTLAITLVLALMLGMCAFSVAAVTPVAQIGSTTYESLKEAVAAVPTNGTQTTITLLEDVTDGSGIVVSAGQNIIFDFQGHTYNISKDPVGSTGTETQAFQLLKGATVTMMDGTITSNCANVKRLIQNYADLTLTNMTIDATVGSNGMTADSIVISINNGTTTIDGTTSIKAPTGGTAFDVYAYTSGGYTAPTVNVNTTGTISGDIEVGGSKPEDTPSLVVNGMNHTDGEVEVSAGSVSGSAVDANKMDAVAQIGDKYYGTLLAAVESVTDGTPTTITLLKDAEGCGIVVPEGRNITFDFNGNTYTVNKKPLAGSSGTENQAFQLLKNSTIVMQDGKIVADDPGVLMMIQNYANLTLLNMELDATAGTNNADYVLSNNAGETAITGSTSITAKQGGVAFDVYGYTPYYPTMPEVTVDTTGKITGEIEIAAVSPAVDEPKLTIKNIDHEGEIDNQLVDGNNNPKTSTIDITGGNFTDEDVEDYLDSSSHHLLVRSNNAGYKVISSSEALTDTVAAALVNGEYRFYESLDDAFAANNDVEVNPSKLVDGATFVVPVGKTVIIGNNTYGPGTYTVKLPAAGSTDFPTLEKLAAPAPSGRPNPSTGVIF